MINWHTFYGIASFIFYKKEVDAMTLEQLNTARCMLSNRSLLSLLKTQHLKS